MFGIGVCSLIIRRVWVILVNFVGVGISEVKIILWCRFCIVVVIECVLWVIFVYIIECKELIWNLVLVGV